MKPEIHIIIFSILALGVISGDCDYGYFEEVNGECKFDCEYDGDNYVSLNQVSFDVIKDECSGVRLAAEAFPSSCNSISDLVYRNDSCTCPFCKCSSTSSTKVIEELSYYSDGPSKNCYEIECEEPYSWYGINDMIFRVDTLDSADNPFDWEDYGTCPPQKCTYSSYYGSNTTVTSGGYWWADGEDSDTDCTEFCYCSSNGDTVCETGWDNIMDNDGLKNAFIRDCGYYYDLAAVK